jgi:hypothetical protein
MNKIINATVGSKVCFLTLLLINYSRGALSLTLGVFVKDNALVHALICLLIYNERLHLNTFYVNKHGYDDGGR